MVKDTVTTALALAGKMPDILRSTRSGSLVEYTQPTRVEPVVLMDDKIVNLPYAGDIMQSLSSIFAGYYLQAVALSVNVGRVDVIKLLDKLNPNRSLDDNLVAGATQAGLRFGLESAEAYAYQLPVPGQPIGLQNFGLEASFYDAISDDEMPKTGGRVGEDSLKIARDVTNLSVGKLLEVEVESDGQKATFPVSIRLITTASPSNGVVHTLSVGSKDNSVKERFHAWRAGQLEFIRDLVLCQDLIDAHKEALIKDNSGIYASTLKRRNKNRLSALLSGSPSVATASNLIVMDDSTRKQLERNIGGRLKDFRTRQKIFKNTYAMLMVVVNQDWDQVTIYHRGIDLPTELSVNELKATNRSKGPDVAEILKAYQLGNSPSL